MIVCPHCQKPVDHNEAIILATCVVTGVRHQDILGRGRTKSVARARYIAALVMRTERGLSYREISSFFKRDEISVSVRRLEKRLAIDPQLRGDVDRVVELIQPILRPNDLSYLAKSTFAGR